MLRLAHLYDMTSSADVDRNRSETLAFRLEIADFGTFYAQTYDIAYRTAMGIVRDPTLAADVTQDAYVAAYRQRDRFRGEAPSRVWLHRIVVNEALTALRRKRPTGQVTEVALASAPDHAEATTSQLALLQALDALPDRHRAAVVLRYYHDYDYTTIAQILETSSTNVGAMLSRALDRLKVALETGPGASDGTGRER
jgi:RNA polymerase sigma-70 factor (ECF subfamily)